NGVAGTGGYIRALEGRPRVLGTPIVSVLARGAHVTHSGRPARMCIRTRKRMRNDMSGAFELLSLPASQKDAQHHDGELKGQCRNTRHDFPSVAAAVGTGTMLCSTADRSS